MNQLKLAIASLEKYDPEIYCCIKGEKHLKLLVTLFQLNLELAKINQNSGEKLISAVKLSWWQEILTKLYSKDTLVIKQPTILLLQEIITEYKIKQSSLNKLIKAREFDFQAKEFANLIAYQQYIDTYFYQIFHIINNALNLNLTKQQIINLQKLCYILKTARIINSLPKHNYNNHPFINQELLEKLTKYPAIERQKQAIILLKEYLTQDLNNLTKLDFPHNFLNKFAHMVIYYSRKTINISNEKQIVYIAKYRLIFYLKLQNLQKKLANSVYN